MGNDQRPSEVGTRDAQFASDCRGLSNIFDDTDHPVARERLWLLNKVDELCRSEGLAVRVAFGLWLSGAGTCVVAPRRAGRARAGSGCWPGGAGCLKSPQCHEPGHKLVLFGSWWENGRPGLDYYCVICVFAGCHILETLTT